MYHFRSSLLGILMPMIMHYYSFPVEFKLKVQKKSSKCHSSNRNTHRLYRSRAALSTETCTPYPYRPAIPTASSRQPHTTQTLYRQSFFGCSTSLYVALSSALLTHSRQQFPHVIGVYYPV